jgi:hypothetical protein
MHQLVLITAMATTTGLFGGGKHCGKSHHCGRKAVMSTCYSASPCGATYAAPQAMPAAWQQGTMTSPQMVPGAPPVPGKMAPPAPPTPATSSLVPNGRSFEPRPGYSPVVVSGNLR